MLKGVKFDVPDPLHDGSDWFQTIIVFVTFYRSRRVLRSVVHRKTTFCIDFVLNLAGLSENFGKKSAQWGNPY